MCKALIIGCAVLMFAGLSVAQVPTSGNIYFGYTYNNADWFGAGRSSFNGWTGSLEGKVFPHVGIVADFSQTFGSEYEAVVCPEICLPQKVSAHEYNMLFGPRVSFSVGRLRPFAEALFGVGHVGADGGLSDTAFATGLGGGVDYRLIRPLAWRFEADYLQTRFFSTTQDNVRLTTGIAFHF
jgi:opacity protein-like surface antigen